MTAVTPISKADFPPSSSGVHATDPLLALERQYAAALEVAGKLDDAARSIRVKGFTAPAFEAIARTAVFLEDFIGKHDALVEIHLLPGLQRLDAALARGFREDHRSMRRLIARLGALVREIEGGRIHGSSVGDLLRTSLELVALLRKHVIHENDILFPLIRDRLTAGGSGTAPGAVHAPGY